MTKKNILLTFDYEPFLGARSGSAQKCMLEPTNALREILNRHKVKAVFFIDTLYLEQLSKHDVNSFNAVAAQVKKLFDGGHFVFPHVHPHWLDAKYLPEKNEFDLSRSDRYSLAAFPVAEREQLIRSGIQRLEQTGVRYSAWGYRAGGWCIQPFSDLRSCFAAEKILYDFSVLPGYSNDHPNQRFDFSNAPHLPYRFDDRIEKEAAGGPFAEFPISTIRHKKLVLLRDRLVRKCLWKTNDRGWGDGQSAASAGAKSNQQGAEMISIELLTKAKLPSYKSFLAQHDYMHWISHPKMFTRHGLQQFDRFLDHAKRKYEVESDFNAFIPR